MDNIMVYIIIIGGIFFTSLLLSNYKDKNAKNTYQYYKLPILFSAMGGWITSLYFSNYNIPLNISINIPKNIPENYDDNIDIYTNLPKF